MMLHRDSADLVEGARNLVDSAAIEAGETVLILGDRGSDSPSMEALAAVLKMIGARPLKLVMDPVSRYGEVPKPVIEAMRAADTVIWCWPVFLTFASNFRRELGLKREDIHRPQTKSRPFYVYFEGTPGLLATDYARFPNEVLWKIAEKVKARVSGGKRVRLVGQNGTDLSADYDGRQLYGIQTKAGEPAGRIHFPWGRCGVFNGKGEANGVVFLDCVQGIPGRLTPALKWTVKKSEIVDVEGGDAALECQLLFRAVPESNRLVEIMFGYHPKASVERGIADPMHWELISKMPWVGLGTPRDHPSFRHLDGAALYRRRAFAR